MRSKAINSKSLRRPKHPTRPKHRIKPRAAPVRPVDVAGPRPAPGSATPPTLERGKLKMWGPHLTAPHGTEGHKCITCARVANHKRARYALKTSPCSGRYGLAGPLQPRRPRLNWNKTNEARWKRQGESGHQVVK